ncbi:MAG: hypothetical protein WC785_04510 [Tatlockia sp.]|jgi:spermidine synthase
MLWKTRFKTCIYHASGIAVYQNWLYRWLQFDSPAVQTLIHRYRPHKPQLNYLPPLMLPATVHKKPCLMLGLGGGGIAHALKPYLGEQKLTIVEANAQVIALARQFFGVDTLTNVDIVHAEASDFLSQSNQCFSSILVDLFTDNHFPQGCSNALFFSHCKRLLEPAGVLAVNLANAREHWPVFQLLRDQFARSTLTIPVPRSSNLIVLAQKSDTILPFIEKLTQLKAINKASWDKRWGYLAEYRG